MSLSREKNPDIKSVQDNQKYIRFSDFEEDEYIKKPFFTRIAWVLTFLLCLISIIPLGIKCVLNAADSIVSIKPPTQAYKNIYGIAVLFCLGVAAGCSALFPRMLGARLTRAVAFPVILMNAFNSSVNNMPSLQDDMSFPEVKGIGDIMIDSIDIPFKNFIGSSEYYRLVFNASLSSYQNSGGWLREEGKDLACHTRAFNYPGITKDDEPGSILDAVNAGIAQIYDLAKRYQWTNEEIEKKLHLRGHCMGGAIALLVAAYFKKKHGINFFVFADRVFKSYLDAVKGFIHAKFGVPLFLSTAIATTFLYEFGNLDCVSAANELDPNRLAFINIVSTQQPFQTSTWNKIKVSLGIGADYYKNADSIIPNEDTLTTGLCSTSKIYQTLDITEHQVIANPFLTRGASRLHNAPLTILVMHSRKNVSAVDYYREKVSQSRAEQGETINADHPPRMLKQVC